MLFFCFLGKVVPLVIENGCKNIYLLLRLTFDGNTRTFLSVGHFFWFLFFFNSHVIWLGLDSRVRLVYNCFDLIVVVEFKICCPFVRI